MIKKKKVKIIGGGPTGSILALALANCNFDIELYEASCEELMISKDRVYALTHSTRSLLNKLSLWDELSEELAYFDSLLIKDSVINKELVIRTSDLFFSEKHVDAIGWTIDNAILMTFLIAKLKEKNNIKINYNSICLDIDKPYEYNYIFAADGTSSPSRRQWKIPSLSSPYSQGCITFKALIRNAHKNRAYEIFRSEGPMAILPIKNDLYQLVISAPLSKCRQLVSLESSYFLDTISTFIPNNIEIDCLCNKPQFFPLQLSIALNLVKSNKYLVGESLHSVHPVGGQGLNLSFRDVNDLFNLAKDNKNDNSYKQHILYLLKRYVDIISIAFLTDLLVRLFSNRSFPITFLRRIIFIFLNKFRFLRRVFLSIMTKGINI